MELIIDNRGALLNGWLRVNGNLIHDKAENNKYNQDFAIGVYYTEEEAQKYSEIKALKKYLKDTDYRALKYADGAYTEEEYAPYRKARAEARARINEIEFKEPTLTREEMDAAEDAVMEHIAEIQRRQAEEKARLEALAMAQMKAQKEENERIMAQIVMDSLKEEVSDGGTDDKTIS